MGQSFRNSLEADENVSLPELMGFKCLRCGRCCLWGGPTLSATRNDIKRWRRGKRHDILKYVDFLYVRTCPKCKKAFEPDRKICDICGSKLKNETILSDLWFNPITGEELHRCPFLRKVRGRKEYRCLIHETKPERCRDFPVVVRTECENCGLNFVKYFKDAKLQHIPLKEYLKWRLNKFFVNVLKDVDVCPRCNTPIKKFHEWAFDNCPGVQHFLKIKKEKA